MNDTLSRVEEFPRPQSIRMETPIGSIETIDDNPLIDGLIVILMFIGFCFYVYARYFKKVK
jgi:hypothetical protein